ncbi:hypothetical protein Hypma_002373 [Hypsizygus marmoreus]|uniref:Uncharacterized protein n=1 Tax=Hypsizygus marmoreus TaxID=39966 RepID=A0A369J4C0_HYPMA|nr:hypothetical protein Hypma_002373 [Hypsizygus marmoreus]
MDNKDILTFQILSDHLSHGPTHTQQCLHLHPMIITTPTCLRLSRRRSQQQAYPAHQQPLSSLSRHQTYPMNTHIHDPRITVQQTNQTLTALASARRLGSPDNVKECSNARYDVQQKQQHYHGHHHLNHSQVGNGDYSEHVAGRRTAQLDGPPATSTSTSTVATTSTSPPAGGLNSKTSEGHACSYCGKAFGRPSALKVGQSPSASNTEHHRPRNGGDLERIMLL